jgi:hypothetical protein
MVCGLGVACYEAGSRRNYNKTSRLLCDFLLVCFGKNVVITGSTRRASRAFGASGAGVALGAFGAALASGANRASGAFGANRACGANGASRAIELTACLCLLQSVVDSFLESFGRLCYIILSRQPLRRGRIAVVVEVSILSIEHISINVLMFGKLQT